MKTAGAIPHAIVRLTGMTQVVLGGLFWSGRALQLRLLHMLVGMIFVIALWALAGLAARAGLGALRTTLVVGWGILIPGFGMAHAAMLPGPQHWVVQVIHLLIGVAAMFIAAALARFIHVGGAGAGTASRTVPPNARAA